jgi:hypothetical protein
MNIQFTAFLLTTALTSFAISAQNSDEDPIYIDAMGLSLEMRRELNEALNHANENVVLINPYASIAGDSDKYNMAKALLGDLDFEKLGHTLPPEHRAEIYLDVVTTNIKTDTISSITIDDIYTKRGDIRKIHKMIVGKDSSELANLVTAELIQYSKSFLGERKKNQVIQKILQMQKDIEQRYER